MIFYVSVFGNKILGVFNLQKSYCNLNSILFFYQDNFGKDASKQALLTKLPVSSFHSIFLLLKQGLMFL